MKSGSWWNISIVHWTELKLQDDKLGHLELIHFELLKEAADLRADDVPQLLSMDDLERPAASIDPSEETAAAADDDGVVA